MPETGIGHPVGANLQFRGVFWRISPRVPRELFRAPAHGGIRSGIPPRWLQATCPLLLRHRPDVCLMLDTFARTRK